MVRCPPNRQRSGGQERRRVSGAETVSWEGHMILNPNYAIKDIVKNIKGESSHWINQENMCPTAFAWQTGYGAFSVSESIVEIVERYIDNQKEHHRKKLFAEEYHEFMMQYGILKTE
jgi:hypothetical protein